MIYDAKGLREEHPSGLEGVPPIRPGGVLWLNVNASHDTDLLQAIGKRFGLHRLTLEDIASTHQRAKMDAHADHLFLTVRMLQGGLGTEVTSEQVSLVLGSGFLISFQEREGDVFGPVRERLRSSPGRIREAGADYLAYALMDVIVDHYFVVLERVSEELEALEDLVLEGPGDGVPARLRAQRSNLIMIRRAVWPLREVVSSLARGDDPRIETETHVFLRDAYDHVVQVIDIVESLRDVVSSLHDLYMASISNRMNEIMKFLTIVGTIFIPLTFIAGVYGMNFADMPELGWKYSYPVALAAMAAIGVSLVFYFRRRKWL